MKDKLKKSDSRRKSNRLNRKKEPNSESTIDKIDDLTIESSATCDEKEVAHSGDVLSADINAKQVEADLGTSQNTSASELPAQEIEESLVDAERFVDSEGTRNDDENQSALGSEVLHSRISSSDLRLMTIHRQEIEEAIIKFRLNNPDCIVNPTDTFMHLDESVVDPMADASQSEGADIDTAKDEQVLIDILNQGGDADSYRSDSGSPEDSDDNDKKHTKIRTKNRKPRKKICNCNNYDVKRSENGPLSDNEKGADHINNDENIDASNKMNEEDFDEKADANVACVDDAPTHADVACVNDAPAQADHAISFLTEHNTENLKIHISDQKVISNQKSLLDYTTIGPALMKNSEERNGYHVNRIDLSMKEKVNVTLFKHKNASKKEVLKPEPPEQEEIKRITTSQIHQHYMKNYVSKSETGRYKSTVDVRYVEEEKTMPKSGMIKTFFRKLFRKKS